jgi:putative protease
VTAAYSERLNELIRRHPDRYERASLGRCTYTFQPDLRKTFNRGYTTHFLHGRQPDIFSPDTPKAVGEYVGKVKEIRGRSFTVAGTARFANGDGLCFYTQPSTNSLSTLNAPPSTLHPPRSTLNTQRSTLNPQPSTLSGFRVNRVEGNRLFPQQMPDGLRPGMALYRNNDMEFERLLSRPSAERKIPIRMQLTATPTGFRLTCRGLPGCLEGTIECEHQQAEKPQRDNIVRQLTKLGGTPYECTDVELPDGFNYFIPSSKLAELRRGLTGGTHPQPLPDREERNYSEPFMERNQHFSPLPPREGQGEGLPLMQCRHCLRYALGYCQKYSNSVGKPPLSGRFGGALPPLYLRLRNGRRFRLDFDCKNCQMNVYAEN